MSKLIKNIFFIQVFILSGVFFQSLAAANDGNRYTQNSVLSQGQWYKLRIPETGVYKLSYDDLKKIGLKNPANVKIFGYGGWILDEDFSKPYIDDLPELSVWMSNDPANFGKNDYILFYARGSIKWQYNTTREEFEQTQNPYSADSYYFVTESDEGPLLMETQASLSGSGIPITTFEDYYLHEQELINVGQTGRAYFGESFASNNSQTFSIPTEGVTADPAIVRFDFIARASMSNGELSVSLNSAPPKRKVATIVSDSYVIANSLGDTIISRNLQDVNRMNISYKRGSNADTRMHLDYIRVNYKRLLKPYGAVTLFRSTTLSEKLSFQIADVVGSPLVFDVTDNTSVKKIDTQSNGSSLIFTASNRAIREYAIVDISKPIPAPEIVGKVSNQNLHALAGAEMIIIVQPYLQKYAEDLARIHKEDSGLESLIVNPDQIYNEFSSGTPDATAYRRFVKMFYDRAQEGDLKPKYLLLFGGGTYDNRLTRKAWTTEEKKSMLLTYQTVQSLDENEGSFTTDDYFGFLDDTEGSELGKDILDIGIGRIPARTASEASDIIAKIQNYITNQNKGIWQSNLSFVADDLIGSHNINTERNHIIDADSLTRYIDKNHPDFISSKIYEDAYKRENLANGARYPEATEALLSRIDNGTLVLNFIGHGGTRSWTHENLLTFQDIEGLNNDKLPLWITATCDFSRFDGDEQSGGELALLKRYGGAVALFSTVRIVLISQNTAMNNSIYKFLLKTEDGLPPRLGDIMRNAKTDIGEDINKLKFSLLGDPALRLAFPGDTYKAEVVEMNGIDATENGINIRALDDVSITGNITRDNEIATGFNGTVEVIVFDSEQQLRTRGNTKNGNENSSDATNYKDYTNTLFSGKVEVINGVFQINFVAPKDILYADAKGKMSFYAYDANGIDRALGSFYNYTVGGTNPNVPEEFNPPVIEKMYLNNEQFVSGDVVNPTPLFYAEISDDTGINLTDAIGHSIMLIVDKDKRYILTSNFEALEGSNKKGIVKFRIPELTQGNHSLEFRVWDVFNNSESAYLDFVVTDAVYSFDIWGNPAKEYTRFVFNTDSSITGTTNVDIKLMVHSLTGRLIWAYEGRGTMDSLNRYIYDWYLNGNGGGRITPGVYICTGQISVNGKILVIDTKKLMVSASY